MISLHITLKETQTLNIYIVDLNRYKICGSSKDKFIICLKNQIILCCCSSVITTRTFPGFMSFLKQRQNICLLTFLILFLKSIKTNLYVVLFLLFHSIFSSLTGLYCCYFRTDFDQFSHVQCILSTLLIYKNEVQFY